MNISSFQKQNCWCIVISANFSDSQKTDLCSFPSVFHKAKSRSFQDCNHQITILTTSATCEKSLGVFFYLPLQAAQPKCTEMKPCSSFLPVLFHHYSSRQSNHNQSNLGKAEKVNTLKTLIRSQLLVLSIIHLF